MDGNPTYNAYEKDIAMVNFYFDKSSILQYIRQERMTKVDYISQIGGLLGLFMGISFISGMAIRVVKFSRGEYKIGNIVA